MGKTKLKKASEVCHVDDKTIKCKEAFTVKAGERWLCLGWATGREFWVAGKIFLDSGQGFSGFVLVFYYCHRQIIYMCVFVCVNIYIYIYIYIGLKQQNLFSHSSVGQKSRRGI